MNNLVRILPMDEDRIYRIVLEMHKHNNSWDMSTLRRSAARAFRRVMDGPDIRESKGISPHWPMLLELDSEIYPILYTENLFEL